MDSSLIITTTDFVGATIVLLGLASTGAESWPCVALLLAEMRSMTACENARLFSESVIFTCPTSS
jgi:hypothetical protein